MAKSESKYDVKVTKNILIPTRDGVELAADLILPSMRLDVVAFGCTSAAMELGEETVFEELRKVRPAARYTTPITGALAAFATLGLRRIAVLTPYSKSINEGVRAYIEKRGVAVTALGTFDRIDDRDAARISAASIRDAALTAAAQPSVDGVFVSCTSLRVAEIAAEVEAACGKPLLSSNLAMAWHCLRLAGIDDAVPEYGMLFEQGLAG